MIPDEEDVKAVLSTTYPVARKSHTCDVCEGEISIGEKYGREVYVLYDGRIMTVRHHRSVLECVMIEEDRQMEKFLRTQTGELADG